MAVQATCYNNPAEDRILLLQHHGVASTAALLSVRFVSEARSERPR